MACHGKSYVEWCVRSHVLHMWVHDRQNNVTWLCVVCHPPTTTPKTGDLMQMSWVLHGHYQEIYPAFWTGSVLECSSDRVWRLLCCSCSFEEAMFCIRNVSERQLTADAVSFGTHKKLLELFSPGSRSVGNKNSTLWAQGHHIMNNYNSGQQQHHSDGQSVRCSQLTWGLDEMWPVLKHPVSARARARAGARAKANQSSGYTDHRLSNSRANRWNNKSFLLFSWKFFLCSIWSQDVCLFV